jgi:hypothetical protein
MSPLPPDLDAPAGAPLGTQGIAVTVHRTGDGYTVQVDVPLAPIQARRGADWSGLGFDVALNDADPGSYRKTQMMWAGIADNYLNAAYFAALYQGRIPAGATRRTLR